MSVNKAPTPEQHLSPSTFSEVEDAHLRAMLEATPAQRLDMAEQLLALYLAAQKQD